MAKTKVKKPKNAKPRTWNNGTVWKLTAKLEKLLDEKKLWRAALDKDSGFIRATAESVSDLLHDFADIVDEDDTPAE